MQCNARRSGSDAFKKSWYEKKRERMCVTSVCSSSIYWYSWYMLQQNARLSRASHAHGIHPTPSIHAPPHILCFGIDLVKSWFMPARRVKQCLRSVILCVSLGLLVLGLTALSPPRADRGDICLESLLLRRVRLGRELDERVERDLHPRTLFLRHVHEVCVYAPQDGLVCDDQDVFAALEFHDDGLQPDHYVAVRLAAEVAVVVLILVA